MKYVTTWIILLMAAAIGITGCSSPSSSIESILNKCAGMSARVNNMEGTPAQKMAYFASQLQAIDTRSCPEDFRVAFQRHVVAWQNAASASANNTLAANFVEGFVASAAGNPGLAGQAMATEADASSAVNSTYQALVEIAIHYGAKIPESVVR